MTPEEGQLWKARAEALLPILEAAVKLTMGAEYEVSSNRGGGGVMVDRDRYYRLKDLCESMREASQAEDARHAAEGRQ